VTFDSINASAAERHACVSIVILKVIGGQVTLFVKSPQKQSRFVYGGKKTWASMLFERLCSLNFAVL
jgi:hypothetical protein